MNVTEMINCCGIREIYNFPGNTEKFGYKISELEKSVILQFVKYRLIPGASYGMTLVAINSLQVSAGVGEVLQEAGMTKILGPCFHPNHGRFIYLYAFVHHLEKNEAEVFRLSREVKSVAVETPSILMNAVKKAG